MMGLSDCERISMIRSAVLIQYTRVTDGWTELAWHIRAIVYMLSRVKMQSAYAIFQMIALNVQGLGSPKQVGEGPMVWSVNNIVNESDTSHGPCCNGLICGICGICSNDRKLRKNRC